MGWGGGDREMGTGVGRPDWNKEMGRDLGHPAWGGDVGTGRWGQLRDIPYGDSSDRDREMRMELGHPA